MIAPPILSLVYLASVVCQVTAQTQYNCPQDGGKFNTVNGKKYELKCGKGVREFPFEEEPSTGLAACAEKCAANPRCVHGTFIEKSRKCALREDKELFDKDGLSTWYFIENVTNQGTGPVDGGDGGDGTQKPIVDNNSGNPSGNTGAEEDPNNQASYSCPADGGKRYVVNGITYELNCNTGHSKGEWRNEPCPTLKECAARCANDKDCYSADWHVASRECYLKKAPAAMTPWSEGHAWWPTQCAKPREAQINKKPEITTDLKCPQNDGKIFEGSDGTWFYLQCCTDASGAVILGYETVSSHKECSEKCVADKKCKSFMFGPGPVPSGQANCRLYTHGKFSTSHQEGVHYAFVTDPPTKDAELSDAKRCSTECPSADGQLYVSPTGENFLMSCKKRHGTTYLKIERRPSFEACMASCAAMPACQSADYEPRTKKCFYGGNTKNPIIAAEAFVSAHSLGCSGACAGCKKGCDLLGDALEADQAACNADHGKLLSAAGEDFRLYCTHCFRSDSGWQVVAAKNLAECTTECAKDPKCHGANWLPAQGCWHHPERDTNGYAPTFGQEAICHAVAPLGRSLNDPENLKRHD